MVPHTQNSDFVNRKWILILRKFVQKLELCHSASVSALRGCSCAFVLLFRLWIEKKRQFPSRALIKPVTLTAPWQQVSPRSLLKNNFPKDQLNTASLAWQRGSCLTGTNTKKSLYHNTVWLTDDLSEMAKILVLHLFYALYIDLNYFQVVISKSWMIDGLELSILPNHTALKLSIRQGIEFPPTITPHPRCKT